MQARQGAEARGALAGQHIDLPVADLLALVGAHAVQHPVEGQIGAPALGRGDGVTAGLYEVELAVGDWFRAQGVDVGTPAFQESIVYRFGHVVPSEHVHLPIKLSPWGVSVWRGH